MVDKLLLKIKDLQHPYGLTWLEKNKEIKVSKRCLVQFSIGGKYKEKVMCDVVPMDACHLLLGRPWQYDRKTMHDGYKNIYSFDKDDVKIVLAPTRLDVSPKPSKWMKNALLSKSKILRELQHIKQGYILVMLEANREQCEHLAIVLPLLQEFADVVPEEMPPSLLPLRSI
ncbi:uncharacterized protein LOC120254982 [Dioscorea cayenensis subsp. rotundata]|uniref:Uncharacterized protein LOC120254982 n=1 Tax=Dioscorea cayennensis subsp. rotundata TaxID=55577 RepID=A0AB40AV36_DIOCR|nr:uncharacterized protein LOC120254982 [Dioscorea cayenensis subsp. rotundata]